MRSPCPQGHAAFKVNNGSEKRFFNRIIDGDTVGQLNQHFGDQERLKMQRLQPGARQPGARNYVRYDFRSASPLFNQLEVNAVENRNVEHTASLKVKIPFGGVDCWGIMLRDMSQFERPNVNLRMVQSSSAYVGQILELVGADAFAPPPYSTMLRWDPPILERWARAVRARIDDLNQKSDWIDRYINECHGTFNLKTNLVNLSKQTSIMTPQQWRELCQEYWPSSFIQSPRRKRLDKLVQDLPSLTGLAKTTTKIKTLAEILEICKEYADEYYRQNKPRRAIPTLVLGRQIRHLCKDNLKVFSKVS